MKRYLLSGASGFFGKYIYKYISESHIVETIGRHKDDNYYCDLSIDACLEINMKYDIVVHAAGMAHITPKTSNQKENFYKVNVGGTKLLLSALSKKPDSFIFISTISVYGDVKKDISYEDDALFGKCPYSKSKIQAERLVLDWGKKNNVKVSILRLPLIIGKNPPGNLGAMIKAVNRRYYFSIGKGNNKRSMVL